MFFENKELNVRMYPSVYCSKSDIKTCVNKDGSRKYLLKDLKNIDCNVICKEGFMKPIMPESKIMPFGLTEEEWMARRIAGIVRDIKPVSGDVHDYVDILKFMDVNHLEYVSTGYNMTSSTDYAMVGVVRWRHAEVGEDAAMFVLTHGDIGSLEVQYEYICTVDEKIVFSPILKVRNEFLQ